jgi:hypothetical protein
MDIAFFANQLQGLAHDPGFVTAAYGRFRSAHNNNAPNPAATLMFVGDLVVFLGNAQNQQRVAPQQQQQNQPNQQQQQQQQQQNVRPTQQRQNKPQGKRTNAKPVSDRKDGGVEQKKRTKKTRGGKAKAKKQAAAAAPVKTTQA